jgi:hypothetical protein
LPNSPLRPNPNCWFCIRLDFVPTAGEREFSSRRREFLARRAAR